ncbi:MAG TPA: HTTM domain-containing protein [Myxococcota bacterium]|nr:HTTM domain-containing protein [Myxococcota bacterium]
MTDKPSIFSRIYENLYRPMDIAGLAIVRMFFGIIVMTEAFRYTDLSRIIAKFPLQGFYFKFRYFEWVEALPPDLMQLVFIAYGISGLLIFVGLFYHFAVLLSALCISYIFLVDATNYLNHFYLVIVFSFMMLFIPAHKGWSLYAFFHRKKSQSAVPGWSIWLIRIQLALVYFFAAVAKMNVDWINGMPLYDWLGVRADYGTGINAYFGLPIVIYFFTYGGLLYDLLVAPLLLYRKTRVIGYGMSLFFHLMNYYLFNIGIFPWFMMATTTIFFDTSWPRRALNFFFRAKFWPAFTDRPAPDYLSLWQKLGLVAMVAHISFQAFFPLRHFVYPGYVAWDEAGHNFSWHMKLRGKNGTATFTVKDPDTKKSVVIDSKRYLSDRQIEKMPTRPFLMLQFAHHLRDLYTAPGEKPAEVYAETRVRINGRRSQRLIDPQVDLAVVAPSEVPGPWVFPIRQPVWNATHKKNRFGPALKKDDIAMRAIHNFEKNQPQIVQKP